MGKLTIAKIRRLDRPGMYGDGGTLFLNISPTGGKSWIQRITIHGRRRDMGLGPWPLVSLQEARDAAYDNRRTVRAGGNPMADRVRSRRVPTFREAAEAVIDANRGRWRGGKTEAGWKGQMTRYAYPVMAEVPLDQITQADVLACLKPIWSEKPETARKLRMRIRQVLQWAEAHGHVTRNVAEAVGGALPAMPAKNRNRRALPYTEMGAALETFAASTASEAVKLCLRFLVLTACRSGEARGATWDEINMAEREWRIPAERTKTAEEHRVPLSDAALAVLQGAKALDDGSGLVFPSPHRSGKALSDMTLTRVLRVTGLTDRTTVHGCRSSFRVWASEMTSAEHAVMELSLGHHVGEKVERAYARSDLLEKRRALMQSWADYLTRPAPAGNVTPIASARRR